MSSRRDVQIPVRTSFPGALGLLSLWAVLACGCAGERGLLDLVAPHAARPSGAVGSGAVGVTEAQLIEGLEDFQSPGPTASVGLHDAQGQPAELPPGVVYATSVTTYEPGVPAPLADASHPESALGPPDYAVDAHAPPRAVSLGNGGTLVLRFEGAGLGDGPGPDLFVFEIGAPEGVELAVSDDGRGWQPVGMANGGAAAIDIGPFVHEGEAFHFVRLRDVAGQGAESAGFPGADIDAVAVRAGSVARVSIPSAVLFAFDDDTLAEGSQDAAAALDAVLAAVRARPGARVIVEGHTDDVGAAAYNQGLSERRAAAVAAYLAGRGVVRSRLTVRGLGALRPAVPNDGEAHRAQNRRVEIVVDGR